MIVLLPDLLWREGAFHERLAVAVDELSGRIKRVMPRDDVAGERDVERIELRGRVLVPGFVNAHSHAFQRVIRGRTHWQSAAAESRPSFWTWREAMYGAALRLTPDEVYDTARLCFIEMLRSGITAVGEFHYLHNDERGQRYGDANELARRVIAAARDVGLRIRLLNVCYATSGIGRPLEREQRRFATPDLDALLEATSLLRRDVAGGPLASVGIAPHSIRAVPRDWLPQLREWAWREDVPLHMHVSEQPAEVDACVATFGMRPVQLLHHDGLLDPRFTAVHATHIDDDEVHALAGSGAAVCACPATERDLGDGFLRAADLLHAGGVIALGTDSQTVIDMFEEARLTEYMERSRRLERNVLTRPGPDATHEVAPVLLDMMTVAGARSLQLETGVIHEGMLADLVALDLEHITLAGWTADTLAAMVTLSAPTDVVRDVWVAGRQVVAARQHAQQEDAVNRFNAAARRIASV